MNLNLPNRLKRKSNYSGEEITLKKVKTMDERIDALVEAVSAQGVLGALVVIDNNIDTPYVMLQNALSVVNVRLDFAKISEANDFQLKIDSVIEIKEQCANIKEARVTLAQKALDQLREICFFINKNQNYVNVKKASFNEDEVKPATTSFASSSIAHKMMLNMGWSGGGLGSQGQGSVDCVTLVENVNRSGLGSATNNLMAEIRRKLEYFSKHCPYASLAFDSEFTKEERALIHKLAGKYRLKSKSSGSGKCRKLTVTHNYTRMDIVKILLKVGGCDEQYTLHIPTKFAHLWSNDD